MPRKTRDEDRAWTQIWKNVVLLITAAPDLLDAAEYALAQYYRVMSEDGEMRDSMSKLADAIKKARGEK